MRKKWGLMFLLGLSLMFFSGTAVAQHSHDHGAPSKAVPKNAPAQEVRAKSFAQTLNVEGLMIAFEVMAMDEHMKHLSGRSGGHGEPDHSESHSIMVTAQDMASKEIVSDARVQYTVTSPSGGKEIGKLEWSGDHYAGGFSPKEKGVYQVHLKIESGGMEREAEFRYEAK